MAARREDMERNGCREYDPEMRKDAARFRDESQAKLEAKIDDHVERTITNMPTREREKLGAELSSGADANIHRKGV